MWEISQLVLFEKKKGGVWGRGIFFLTTVFSLHCWAADKGIWSSLMEVGVVKEDLMALGNGVIIVMQDQDAYCHWQGVRCKWDSSSSDIVNSKTRFSYLRNPGSIDLFSKVIWSRKQIICISKTLFPFCGIYPNWNNVSQRAPQSQVCNLWFSAIQIKLTRLNTTLTLTAEGILWF